LDPYIGMTPRRVRRRGGVLSHTKSMSNIQREVNIIQNVDYEESD
jgi:hypothetical protein